VVVHLERQGVTRNEIVGGRLLAVLQANDVIGQQLDINVAAAFVEAGNTRVAAEFEFIIQPELHGTDGALERDVAELPLEDFIGTLVFNRFIGRFVVVHDLQPAQVGLA